MKNFNIPDPDPELLERIREAIEADLNAEALRSMMQAVGGRHGNPSTSQACTAKADPGKIGDLAIVKTSGVA